MFAIGDATCWLLGGTPLCVSCALCCVMLQAVQYMIVLTQSCLFANTTKTQPVSASSGLSLARLSCCDERVLFKTPVPSLLTGLYVAWLVLFYMLSMAAYASPW